ncbi:MAG: bifunctional glutamate N-acetyltransferase/amino-acid acetyltransferase ArgJ [Thermodesulfovibrionales bacterium]|nr:bifunctional glutamate N-acetyltransferase/amino-acid acetyltransferase ArgJ [Thermodesulfovibrionales bacterium]
MRYCTPKGYSFSVTEAAIKKPGRSDLALISCIKPAVVSAMFTTNKVKAAPVLIDIRRIKNGLAQAIIINSGNANACTGKQGLIDADEMTRLVSTNLKINKTNALVCSTGVIGTPMPMQRIRDAIPPLIMGLGHYTLHDVAKAIMTTDTFEKISSKTIKMDKKEVCITGIAKGAGMISPNMATMLCFILTDCNISKPLLDKSLQSAVKNTFNLITVDGDMSTNDTVIALANGLADNPLINNTKDINYKSFDTALREICYELALMIVRDGEGASKVIVVDVINAKTMKDADISARAIANSLLVKTAIYGNDANWGRIMSAIGYSGARINPDKVDISINGIMVTNKGLATGNDEKAKTSMKKSKEVNITVNLNNGSNKSRVITCDLTENYVKINAEYRT